MKNEDKINQSTWQLFRDAVSSGDDVMAYEVHRWLGYPFFILGVNSRLTGNHLTIISFFISICGAASLLHSDYTWRLIGVILIQIGLGVDTVDGPLARYKKQASEFGAWISVAFVTLKTNIIWSCAAYSVFLSTGDPMVLLLGLITICHLSVSYQLMRENIKYSFYQFREGSAITGKYRMGLEHSLDMILLIFVAFNWMPQMFVFMSFAGFIPWLILLIRGIQSQRKSSA